MKNILLSLRGFENNTLFSGEDINGAKGPWKLLKEKLFELGYNFKTVDQNTLSNCSRIIFVDETSLGNNIKNNPYSFKSLIKIILHIPRHNKHQREIYDECIEAGLKDKMILILWEGSSVNPNNYKQELYNKFSTILTWDDNLVDNKKFFKFYLPYPIPEYIAPIIHYNEKKFLVNISMNKSSNSSNDLYRMRKKSIKFFEKKLNDQFDLFGYYWNKAITWKEKVFPFLINKYASYRGTSPNKLQTLSRYKFSLCYENMKGSNGYLTEKIFDCFRAQTIPIYWGAENITNYVDKDTFIDRRKFKSDQELLIFLEKIDEKEYNRYLTAIGNFLNSNKYKLFLPNNFVDIIIKNLKLINNK